ncbi:MAG: hypothetical protein JO080_09305 [Mucilaginibacter sp.]|nr:hypothetical protein [Mucilaginibacter sp.]
MKPYLLGLIFLYFFPLNKWFAQQNNDFENFVKSSLPKNKAAYADQLDAYRIKELKQSLSGPLLSSIKRNTRGMSKSLDSLVKKRFKNNASQPNLFNDLRRYPLHPEQIVLTSEEKRYISVQLDQLKNKKLDHPPLLHPVAIFAKSYEKLFYQKKNLTEYGWTDFHKLYGDGYFEFSKPILIRNNKMCVFYIGYHCGGKCGYGDFSVYKIENGQWVKIAIINSWVY